MNRRRLLRFGAQLVTLALCARMRAARAAQAVGTGWIFDERFLTPVFADNHPEQPRRVRAVIEAVQAANLFSQLNSLPVREDIDAAMRLIHSPAHIESIRLRYGAAIDGSARAGVGAALAAVDAVHAGRVRNVFVCSRPPGHHARNTGREEGFCFYNNVAVAARYAQRVLGLPRILIVDWDYHHGDGTESFFYDDASVLYFSTHDWHAYPGTGDPARTGEGAGVGYNINVPLRCGATDAEIITAFETRLLPAADNFKPDLVLVSAGFDSRAADLLGCFDVTDAGFVALTQMVMAVAERHCEGRLVSVLEGGYNLGGLGSAVVAHLQTLLDMAR